MRTLLYRMTHIKNIPHILSNGVTHSSSPRSNPDYVSIGDSTIIYKRTNRLLQNGKLLGSYIPFYFGYRMPMLFVIQNGLSNVNPTAPDDIVYCITSVEKIIEHGLPYIFTNGHAVDGLTELFGINEIDYLQDIIDKQAISAKYWKDENDLDLKRRKEAEFLVEADIPITAILGYVVFNSIAKNNLLTLGINQNKVIAKPNYYF